MFKLKHIPVPHIQKRLEAAAIGGTDKGRTRDKKRKRNKQIPRQKPCRAVLDSSGSRGGYRGYFCNNLIISNYDDDKSFRGT